MNAILKNNGEPPSPSLSPSLADAEVASVLPSPLPAFAAIGIELEYMIVERASLAVAPLADLLLRDASGQIRNEIPRGPLAWSNELALHVLEIKNPRPSPTLALLPTAFQAEVRQLNRLLAAHDAQLMPGAMHPWMRPSEMRLWPHDHQDIYRAYDRIFDCRGHGWANLQSMHINLPFADDREFARLHAAVRLVLPILPALAASSPLLEGQRSGWMDTRLRVYCDNAPGFAAITGQIVPETVASRAAYEEQILAPMYRAIAPHDPAGLLQQEWLNSRGAIARFDRHAIEIRVLDTQECPQADLAIAAATCATVRELYRQTYASLPEQQDIATEALAKIFQDCVRDAELSFIDDAAYLRLLGFPGRCCTARELWWHLVERMQKEDGAAQAFWQAPLQRLLAQGTLARRIMTAAGKELQEMEAVYRELCACLEQGRMF